MWLSEVGPVASAPFSEAELWIAQLLIQPMSCKRLDPRLLSDLLSSSDIRIGSEASSRRVSSGASVPEDSDSVSSGTVRGLFSAPAFVMRPLPPLPSSSGPPISKRPRRGTSTPATPGSAASPPATTTPSGSATVVRRWSRDLDNTAAQQVLGPKSNPTGNLRLTQAGHGIRHETYFYMDFFNGLPWAPRLGTPGEQEVLVDFACVVNGSSLGVETLRVSHNPARISSQFNVPSLIHWGRRLGALLRGSNYIGQYVTLERMSDGTFRLTIDSAPTGPFIA